MPQSNSTSAMPEAIPTVPTPLASASPVGRRAGQQPGGRPEPLHCCGVGGSLCLGVKDRSWPLKTPESIQLFLTTGYVTPG